MCERAAMSDGLLRDWDPAEPAADSVYEPRTRVAELDLSAFVEWLPRLGTVLWLHQPRRESNFPRARLTERGVLLLEHPDIAAFGDVTAIRARSAVTPHGPREWLDFDTGATTRARMYLLPDTDYLAWDAMCATFTGEDATVGPRSRWQAHRTFMRCAFARARTAWVARVVRMPLLRLPCLQVLGARDAASVSALGRRLAAAIAADEQARV
jgi:hypothetical protein